jgi:hypothetical protein
MKRLSIFLAAGALLCSSVVNTACKTEGGNDPVGFSVETTTLNFSAEGGPSNTQTVNVTSGAVWDARPVEKWIHVSCSEGYFEVTVDKNESNDPRTGTISVFNLDNDSETVSVTQEAGEGLIQPVVVVHGRYFAKLFEKDGYHSDVYSLKLYCDVTLDETGSVTSEGYSIDLFFFAPAPANVMHPVIPSGKYLFPETLPGEEFPRPVDADFTAIPYNSVVAMINSIGAPTGEETEIVGGYFDLEENEGHYNIYCHLMLETGKTLRALWDGPANIKQGIYLTDLEGDLAVPKMTGSGRIDYYREIYGNYNYIVNLFSSGISMGAGELTGNGDRVMLEFNSSTANATALPDGTYPIVAPYDSPDTAVAGKYYDGEPCYSWYQKIEDGVPVMEAPFVDGEITVSNSGGNYTITFDVYDDAGFHITGTYEGSPIFTDVMASPGR